MQGFQFVKLVKAYVRARMARFVVKALVDSGCRDFSATDIRGLAKGLHQKEYAYSEKLGDEYERIVEFDVVCRDENVQRLVAIIREVATTGKKGDGMIFVLPVEDAIRISSGERGEGTLPM